MLKRKPEPTDTITVRVPKSVKDGLAALEKAADERGFDLRGTLTEVVVKAIEDMEKEIRKLSDSRPHHAAMSHPDGAAKS